MFRDPFEDVGEPGLRIDVVHLCADDEAIHFCSPLSPPIRTRKKPRLATQGYATKGALRRIIGQADLAIVEEPGYPSGVIRLA
jgi:hypothetical protein